MIGIPRCRKIKPNKEKSIKLEIWIIWYCLLYIAGPIVRHQPMEYSCQ